MNELRLRVIIQGIVQGVGFRPFVYRMAKSFGLRGYVTNTSLGVEIEAEGFESALTEFLEGLQKEKPAAAKIRNMETSRLDLYGYQDFEILESSSEGSLEIQMPVDLATCDKCLAEVIDENNRRYNYPFTNCTDCGPRYSIIKSLPYDRTRTSMANFEMCPTCQYEYEDPMSRRFHAQPNACPDCGPQLFLCDGQGQILCHRDEALTNTVRALEAGAIVAIKGLTGFHLVADAKNEEAVQRLRKRKKRPSKPFAILFLDTVAAGEFVEFNELAITQLNGSQRPIVLCKKKSSTVEWLSQVAPKINKLGVMLPNTPLHYLLSARFGGPLIMTSANMSEEPLLSSNSEAVKQLQGVADFFLCHDRDIVRPVDDSLMTTACDRVLMLRRARGYSPFSFSYPESEEGVLAVGGHLKNTVAMSRKKNIVLSQHLGDLSTSRAINNFENVIEDLNKMFKLKENMVLADEHPEYESRKYADSLSVETHLVQHHLAHLYAVLFENEVDANALGVSWDGFGLGESNELWGGEFFYLSEDRQSRIGRMKPFPLPGGESAHREPRKTAFGALCEVFGDEALLDNQDFITDLTDQEVALLYQVLQTGKVAKTSSVGRLFDAVSSILGVCQKMSYEGEAAMALESLIEGQTEQGLYSYTIESKTRWHEVNWHPIIKCLMAEAKSDVPRALLSARFHNTLAEIIVAMAQLVGLEQVVLSGGVFQNVYLLERVVQRLKQEEFKVYWPQRLPPNDGCLAIGQMHYYFKTQKK